jgi:hypothetical protein
MHGSAGVMKSASISQFSCPWPECTINHFKTETELVTHLSTDHISSLKYVFLVNDAPPTKNRGKKKS